MPEPTPGLRRSSDEPLEVFYADPVDEDGNVVGTASLAITHSPWPTRAVKVPHSELAIEDMPTIRAEVPER